MIHEGETIENPVTGERVTFLETSAQTGGKYVLVEMELAPGGFVAAEHLHPFQSERFEVLSGEVEFKVGGELLTATAGDTVTVEAGTPHRFRNVGGEEIRFRTEVRPALAFETFLETMFGLAADGKTDAKGMPNPLRLAVIMDQHFDLVRIPFPPVWAQRAGLALGSPFGRLLGSAPTYASSRGGKSVERAAA